jgi:hypothetical protein
LSLCYDFEKWIIISLASIAITLTVGLLMQYAHGQNMTSLQNMTILKTQLQLQQKSLEELINYCFQHADRPNPLQDLIDKGFLSESFRGETCLSVKQMHNEVLTRIREVGTRINEQNKNLTIEAEKAALAYTECLQNKSSTFEECYRIIKEE